MEPTRNGQLGVLAALPVELVLKLEQENVTIQNLNTVVKIAILNPRKH